MGRSPFDHFFTHKSAWLGGGDRLRMLLEILTAAFQRGAVRFKVHTSSSENRLLQSKVIPITRPSSLCSAGRTGRGRCAPRPQQAGGPREAAAHLLVEVSAGRS